LLTIDAVLRLLKDEKWHDLAEITEKFASDEFKVEMIISFLSNYGFIEFDRKNRKVKICPLTSSFISEIYRVKEEEAIRALRLR
jgi:predicted transcriptional regulator